MIMLLLYFALCRIVGTNMWTGIAAILLSRAFLICKGAIFEENTYTANSDAGLTITQIIKKYDYPVEVHSKIETEDGYLLTLHRIPSSNSSGAPVLLVHGIFGAAEHFVTSGRNRSLAFLLADRNYDVWLANVRGTSHSRYHVRLRPDVDAAFWNYSFHDTGLYDLPALIDYILGATNRKKLFYVGHSMGTTSFFALCSERPEYNDKIQLMVALSPIAYVEYLSHPWLRELIRIEWNLLAIANYAHLNELLPARSFILQLGQFFCKQPVIASICQVVISAVAGFNDGQFVPANIPSILTSTPQITSMKALVHMLQLVRLKSFSKFDYGLQQNVIIYNSTTPAHYSLNKVSAPVAVFYSENDWFVSSKDVARLVEEIQRPVLKYLVTDNNFSHIDFLWAKDIVSLLYNPVIDILEKFE